MTEPPARQVIPGGSFEDPIAHLFPIAQLLIARGHEPARDMWRETFGFHSRPDGWVCALKGGFTSADRDAILEAFELPPNIVWIGPLIRDTANWADIYGVVIREDG